MPWQRMVADVGGEIDPDTGLPAFREVVVTVPRQSGKTTLILSWELQRALGWDGPQRIAYSAQDGNAARKKLLEDQFPLLESRKRTLGIRRCLKGSGNEAVEFLNGSRITLMASTADSGHGKTLDLAIKDEFFADYDDRRDQAMLPAMMTRASAQMLTASTMGTDESVPLNRAVDRGRLAVRTDTRTGIAYFEWSADPDEDPEDPATWWRCMPALGQTVTETVVRHARSNMTESDFRRAYLNQRTKADDRVIPASKWDAVTGSADPTGVLTFALDINPERSAGAIVAASGGDVPIAELVEYRPSIGWMADRAQELDTKWGKPRWIIDGGGPANSLVAALVERGLNVHVASGREMIDACGQVYDGIIEGRVRFRSHPRFDEAAAGAAKRSVGDAWAWTRKNAAADISPLVAATLALWGASQADPTSVYENDRGLLVL